MLCVSRIVKTGNVSERENARKQMNCCLVAYQINSPSDTGRGRASGRAAVLGVKGQFLPEISLDVAWLFVAKIEL